MLVLRRICLYIKWITPIIIVEPCEDGTEEGQTGTCLSWKNLGLCEEDFYKDIMEKYCKKTCRLCPEESKFQEYFNWMKCRKIFNNSFNIVEIVNYWNRVSDKCHVRFNRFYFIMVGTSGSWILSIERDHEGFYLFDQ